MKSPLSGAALAVTLLALPLVAQPDHSVSAARAARDAAPAALQTITADDLKRRLGVIASDAFAGRLTGTPGQRKTARLVAAEFARLGLVPLGDRDAGGQRGYLQEWPVTLLRTAAGTGLHDEAGLPLHRHGAWLLPRSRSAEEFTAGSLSGTLARIRADRRAAENPESLEGLLPIVPLTLRPEPETVDIYAAFREGLGYQAAQLRGIASRLGARGATMGVVVLKEMNRSFLSWTNGTMIFPGKPLVSRGHDSFKLDRGMPPGLQPRIPLLIIEAEDAAHLFTRLGTTPEAFFADTDDGAPALERATLTFRPELVKTVAHNVAAMLPGQKGADEAIVYSAHMDHVGRAADGTVFNGADDNGSGTSTLLELAEAWAAVPEAERPPRNVIFLSVSGEELGLWGSEHWSENPNWPLEKTVANVNVDMIGRNTEDVPRDVISVTPTFERPEYSTLAREAAFLGQAFDLKMTNGDRFYERSDHYNFAKNGIPVIFFCDDEHIDYHMPTDTAEKIDYEKAARVGRLAFLLGWRTAHAEGSPSVLGRQSDWFGGR